MDLTLVRWAYGSAFTLGTWYIASIELATIERPWIPDPDTTTLLAGKENESCVPDGEYVLRPHISEKYPANAWAYALVNPALGVYYADTEIPAGQKYGRSKVLIHPANYVRQLQGCIAPGMSHRYSADGVATFDSVPAMRRIREILGKATHRLIIRPTAGTNEKR